MALKYRFYLAIGTFFEVYDDGTVIFYDKGKEVARQKMERPSRSAILLAFEDILRRKGLEIAGLEAVMNEKLDDILEGIAELKKKK